MHLPGSLVALAAAASVATGDILYVDQAALGGDDGSSWESAFRTLQQALDAAQDGDEVWLAAGTYRPAPMNGDRSVSFSVDKAVVIRGGFVGGELLPEGRPALNGAAPPTILSGDLNGDDAAGYVNRGDNSRRVLLATGPSIELDRLTIKDGDEDRVGLAELAGTGLRTSALTVKLIDCTIADNRSSATTGAGVFVLPGAAVELTRTTFRSNLLDDFGNRQGSSSSTFGPSGAALSLVPNQPATAPRSSVTMDSCMFADNRVSTTRYYWGSSGGGAAAFSNCDLSISRSRFEANSVFRTDLNPFAPEVGQGGALLVLSPSAATPASTVTVVDCIFDANRIDGVDVDTIGGALRVVGTLDLDRCVFTGNSANGGADAVGGAVSTAPPVGGAFVPSSSIERCTFTGNSANSTATVDDVVSARGGAVELVGANTATIRGSRFDGNAITIGATDSSRVVLGSAISATVVNLLIDNCVVTRNVTDSLAREGAATGREGHAVGAQFSFYTVASSTIADNTCVGAAFPAVSGQPTLVNTIVHGNRTATGSLTVLGQQVNLNVPPVSASIVESGLELAGSVLDVDPAFVARSSGDYRLTPFSPAVDAGTNAAADPSVTEDVTGHPRIVDGDLDGTPTIDIGALEFQPATSPCNAADQAQRFGVLDVNDVLTFASAFAAGDPAADTFPSAGEVILDISDILTFAILFNAGCP